MPACKFASAVFANGSATFYVAQKRDIYKINEQHFLFPLKCAFSGL